MIKIEHPNLSHILRLHTEACLGYVKPRLDFSIAIFRALSNQGSTPISNSIKETYGLNLNSVISIMKPFIKKNERKSITIDNIKSTISSNQSSWYITSGKIRNYKKLYNFLVIVQEDLCEIITAKPEDIQSIISKNKFNHKGIEKAKEVIESIFSYETLTDNGFHLKNGRKWNNYSVTEALNISVCPYCNRSYVNTVRKGVYVFKKGKRKGKTRYKVTNPQLDHYFSKSDYPLFRLSFYNLIPSCETCNARLKKAIEFKYDENLHPYVDGYGKDCRFETSPNDYLSLVGKGINYDLGLNVSCNVDAKKKKKVEENHKVFEIDTIYKDHLDIVSEIYRKKAISNDKYMEILIKQFPSAGLSKAELYRLAFGNYYEEVDFKKRPFAKLTRDTVEQLQLFKLN